MLHLGKLLVNFVELLAIHLNFIVKSIVFSLKLLIFVALLRVQIVKTGLVGIVDLLDLLFISVQLVLHVLFFSKKRV